MTTIRNPFSARGRILLLGEPRLSDAECLALVLRGGTAGRSAEQIGCDLLRRFGSLGGLAGASICELTEVTGVGLTGAVALDAAFGLARRLAEARLPPGRAVRGGGDVARLVRESTRDAGRETFWVLLLDTRHRVSGLRLVSVGSLQTAPVHPREVFGPAIRERAAAIVVAHNHPSGDPTPSADDRLVTGRLQQVGELCGIELLDHVVVGHDRYWSFADDREHPLSQPSRAAEPRP